MAPSKRSSLSAIFVFEGAMKGWERVDGTKGYNSSVAEKKEEKRKIWRCADSARAQPLAHRRGALSQTAKLNGRPLCSAKTSLFCTVTTTTSLIYICYGLVRKDIAVTRRLDSISTRQS